MHRVSEAAQDPPKASEPAAADASASRDAVPDEVCCHAHTSCGQHAAMAFDVMWKLFAFSLSILFPEEICAWYVQKQRVQHLVETQRLLNKYMLLRR